jgi:ribosomal protein L19
MIRETGSYPTPETEANNDKVPILLLRSGEDFESVQKRYREYARRFHTDNPDTGDHEKFVQLQDDWKKILSHFKENDQLHQTRSHSDTSEQDLKKIEEKSRDALQQEKERLLNAISEGPDAFNTVSVFAKNHGVMNKHLQEFVKSSEVQNILKEELHKKVKTLGEFTPGDTVKYTQKWDEIGIPIGQYINSVEINKLLEELASIRKRESFDEFKNFVVNWQRAGWVPEQHILALIKKGK